MERLVARDKYLFEGDRKFFIRGVSYGTFRPNSRGEEFPERNRAAADLALMRNLGANVIRTYTPPPPWLLEEAAKAGVRVLAGIPWPYHMTFLDSPQLANEIRATVRKAIQDMHAFPDAIAAYSLGNEIRSDIVRWHGPRAVSRFLAELHDLGKQIDPEGLFTYSNYPTTEYLDLSFLDFVSFNVYLHREEDFRRYLTHLMAATEGRPLVLSETGMDTIREGEAQQAQLLSWQARATFELGLSGFVVFAFTDEWYRGGADITDWAFGLTTAERAPKQAYHAVREIFRGDLPPPLKAAPRASVIVSAYNAESTLEPCLASLKTLHYPDYEVIVVDDGSTDSTARIAEAAGVRTVRAEHRGLGAARNAGIAAASGEIAAFIDSDARADRDWLYHLVESITRRDAGAAGGPNFAPHDSDSSAAFAAAPGIPREVRGPGDELSQLCGCNMAVRKQAADAIGGFDPVFERAGDDVDFSWRLAANSQVLVDSPGAVVIHERRATLADYLRQQRGYGAGEGLLFRKYPLRRAAAGGVYGGGGSWLAALLGGPRVYYGAFGRGLFQTLYAGSDMPWLAELPQSVEWVAASALLFGLGARNPVLGFLGWLGIAIWIATACLGAAFTPMPVRGRTFSARATLAILYLLGPLVRSFERERVRLTLEPAARDVPARPFRSRGRIVLIAPESLPPAGTSALMGRIGNLLVRFGIPVAITDGFQDWDLNLVLVPALRVPLNLVRENDGRLALVWRTSAEPIPIAAGTLLFFLVLAGAGLGWVSAAVIAAVVTAAVLAPAFAHLRMVPSLLEAAAEQAARECGMSIAHEGEPL